MAHLPSPPPSLAPPDLEAVPVELQARLQRLNPNQLQAVLSEAPATLVQAQVGSGKTTVLAHKVLYLHLVVGVPLDALAVLTFTQKAAAELRSRVRELVPRVVPGDFWLTGTFHAVARALLLNGLPLERIGYARPFQVLDAHQRQELWEQLIDEHDLNVKYRAKLARRWEAWHEGRQRYGNMRHLDDMGRLVSLTQAAKQARNAMDFEDLLRHASNLLDDAPRLTRPRWILIDEFQDTSPDQLAFAERLAGPDTQWFVVGDPNQVIYSWRGSSPELFRRFLQARQAQVFDLPLNYRSSGAILAGARAVQAGAGGALVGTREMGEPIAVRDHHDPLSEARYLVERLRRLHASGVPWREVAVLFRTRHQLEPLRLALREAAIPCAEPGASGVREAPAAEWVLGLLRAGLQPEDLDAARRALTHPHYGVLGARRLPRAAVQRWCEEHGTPGLAGLRGYLTDRLERARRGRGTRDALRAALTWVTRLLELPAWLALVAHDSPDDLAAGLSARFELELALRPTASTWARDVEDTGRWLRRWLERAQGVALPLQTSLLEVLESCARDAGRSAARGPLGDGVRIMTLHASKGLEFQHVFLAGINEGLLPLSSAWRDAETLAEERRLLYVGLTRAKDSVEISWYRQPPRPDARPEPSSFLHHLPSDHVRWVDAADPMPHPAPQPAVAEDPDGWRLGQSVRHRRYGRGELCDLGAEHVEVDFPGRGRKRFARRLCPLTPA